MLSGRYDSGFALALMAKDLGIAMTLAAQIGSPMRLGDACARDVGRGGRGVAAQPPITPRCTAGWQRADDALRVCQR